MDDGGYVPAGAELTWSRRFGDCKGKTVVLLALLRDLGIDARPALISIGAGDGLDQRLPMVGAFDHVLVMATIGGRSYWLDGTRTGDRSLDQIRTPEFHWALPLTPAGSDLVPLVPDALVRPQIVTTLDLDSTRGIDVPAKVTGEQRFEGDAALTFRIGLAQMPPDRRDRQLRRYWHERYDFVTAESVGVINEPATGALRLTMTGTAVMDWSRYSGRRWYAIDGGRLGFHFDTARDPGPDREAPFAVEFPSWIENRQTILLPNRGDGFIVDGKDVDQTIAAFDFHRSVTLKANRLSVVASTRATRPEISFAEAEKAKKALDSLGERDVSIGTPTGYAATDADVAALKATTPTTVDGFVERGELLLDRREYDDALRDADAAVAMKTDDARGHALRALALAWKIDPAFAAAADRALALDAKQSAAWHARAIFADQTGHLVEAEAALTAALDIQPDDIFALTTRAYERQRLGRPALAVDDLKAAIRLRPENRGARSALAELLSRIGRRDEAMAESDRLIREFPDDIAVRVGRIRMLTGVGRKADALAASDALVAAHPADDEVRFLRAMTRKQLGDRDGALADFATLLARKPRGDLLIDRAQVWPITDRAHWAADLDQAAKLGVGPEIVLKTRVVLEARAGNYAAAATALAAAERIDPSDSQLFETRLDLLQRQGKRVEALAAIEARVKSAPADGRLLNTLCWTKVTLNVQLASAVSDCDAALKLLPNTQGFLDSRGLAHFRLGEIDAAIADYDAALAQRPDQAASLYGRALAKAKSGKDGRADFAAARGIDPAIDKQFASYGITP